jgi:aspartyl-tRNA(Asn)/glutamyl-tRNA(Gln) amidotransferase subunit A
MPLAWTMDKIGPMCRTAEDCGIVLQAIAGKDENDPGTAGKSFYFAPQFQREMKAIRVGYSPVDFEEWASPATRPVFRQALDAFRSLGVTLVETKLPSFPYGAVTRTVITTEALPSSKI